MGAVPGSPQGPIPLVDRGPRGPPGGLHPRGCAAPRPTPHRNRPPVDRGLGIPCRASRGPHPLLFRGGGVGLGCEEGHPTLFMDTLSEGRLGNSDLSVDPMVFFFKA